MPCPEFGLTTTNRPSLWVRHPFMGYTCSDANGSITYSSARAAIRFLINLFTDHHSQFMSSLAVMYVLAILLTKLSICFLYLRIFGIHKTFSTCVKAGIWFCVVYYTAGLGLGIAQVTKCATISTIGDPLCVQTQNLTLWQAVINVTTDIYLLVLPLAPISHLQMRRRKKFGVLLIFLSGLV